MNYWKNLIVIAMTIIVFNSFSFVAGQELSPGQKTFLINKFKEMAATPKVAILDGFRLEVEHFEEELFRLPRRGILTVTKEQVEKRKQLVITLAAKNIDAFKPKDTANEVSLAAYFNKIDIQNIDEDTWKKAQIIWNLIVDAKSELRTRAQNTQV